MDTRITIRSIVLGLLFTVLFSILTVYFENRFNLIITATQIAVLPYVLIIAAVLMINPICRLIRIIKPFSVAEIMLVFIMTSVSAGVPTFGMASQVVPIASSLFNGHWNNDQSQWDLYIEPYVNESYFVSEEGIQEAALAYKEALEALETAEDEGASADVLEPLMQEATKRKAVLDDLEEAAFEKVEVFRRGLPRGLRAYPGFVKLPDENMTVYRGRFRRLVNGRGSMQDVQEAKELAAEQGLDSQASRIDELLESAASQLATIASAEDLEVQEQALAASWQETNQASVELDQRIQDMYEESRMATTERRDELHDEIFGLNRDLIGLNRDKRDIAREQEAVKLELESTTMVAETIESIEDVRQQLADGSLDAEAFDAQISGVLQQYPRFDATLKRFLLGDVPWSIWMGPLARWMLILILSYMIMMTFNVLVFRQWAYNERLIYPLAQLPELMVGADPVHQEVEDKRWLPPMFYSGLFWVGFSISAGVLGWNLLAQSGYIPGLPEVPLIVTWGAYVADSPLAALSGARFAIFFTMIGLAFIIPAEISFSLWFFWVLYMCQLLLIVWLGHGVNEGSFPSDWYYTFNFRTAEAGGALIVFAAVVLWKCRKYLFSAVMLSGLDGLESAERKELRVASALFIVSSVGLILILWLGMGANVFYTIFVYFGMLVITIGLVRAVAEGGVLGFQAWISPFHYIRSIFGMDKSWTSPHLYGPLIMFYSVLFLDIKTFIAPAMANTLKIRDDLKMKRLRFHVAVTLALLAAMIVSLAVHVMLGYGKGGDAMSTWFYNHFPKGLYDTIASISRTNPVDSTAANIWVFVGAGAMAMLLFGRQYLFWLPHPIGLIMLVNPIMRVYWSSILIGWISKKMITKYGNKDTYHTVRWFFIGLIVGELILVALAALLSYLTETQINITLNRN